MPPIQEKISLYDPALASLIIMLLCISVLSLTCGPIYSHCSDLVPCEMPSEFNFFMSPKTIGLCGSSSFGSSNLPCYISLRSYEILSLSCVCLLKGQGTRELGFFRAMCFRFKAGSFGLWRVLAIIWHNLKCNYASPISMTRLIYLTPRETARPKNSHRHPRLNIYCTQDIEVKNSSFSSMQSDQDGIGIPEIIDLSMVLRRYVETICRGESSYRTSYHHHPSR